MIDEYKGVFCCFDLVISGYDAAIGKTAPWPTRGFHHLGKFLEPSDELVGGGYCYFLLR